MKKLIVAVALIATLAMVGSANAICLEIIGYCDQIELYVGYTGPWGAQLYGEWDRFCTGTDLAHMMGSYKGGWAIISTWWQDYGYSWQMVVSTNTMLLTMYKCDPGQTPTPWLTAPWQYVGGDCPFAAPGLPAALAN